MCEQIIEGKDDKFYVDKENQKVQWVYYNPDSNAGSQYVYNNFDFSLIAEAIGEEDFFDYIGYMSKQELVDIDTDDFEEADKEFDVKPYTFIGDTEETRLALIKLLQPVASIGICNTASLNIYEIKYGIDDKVLAGINDQCPEWCNITEYNYEDPSEGEDVRMGFKYGETVYYLDEALKTGGMQ